MATLRAQASVEDENNTGTVMKKLILEHKPNIHEEILFQVPNQTEHSPGLNKYGLGPCFMDAFPEFLGKYYPHDIPLPLARSTADWAPDWENYSKSRPFKVWVTSTLEYNDWLVRVEKAKGVVWKKAGIYNAILMSYDMPNPDTALISALAFFWSSSTNAFHFPCGPMTPTLQDVAFITGLRPHGIEANDALESPKVSFEYPKKKDITFYYFLEQNAVTDDKVEVSEMEHIAFLIYWLNKFIFCSSHLKITRYYTDLAKALSVGQEIALAPIFLAHFYRCMKDLVDHQISSCTGPLWLLQFWAWSYFSDLAPEETPKQKQGRKPGEKVFCGLYLKSLVPKEHSFEECFKYLYCLAEDPYPDFWTPFERNSTCPDWLQTPTEKLSPEDPVHRAVWASFLVARDLPYGMDSSGPNNKCGVEYYNPTQCSRQFGLAQLIPIPPFQTINSDLSERMLLTLDDTKKLMEKNAALISQTFKLAPFPDFPLTSPAFDAWWKVASFSQSSESLELLLGRISPTAVPEELPKTKEAKKELLVKKTKTAEKAKAKPALKKKGTPSRAEIYQSIRKFETFFKCKWNPRNPEAMEEARRNRMAEIETRQRDLAVAAWWKIFTSTPSGQPMPSLEDLKKPFGKPIPPTPNTSFVIANTLAYEGMYELYPENRRVTVVNTDAPQWEIEDFYKRGIVRVINSAEREAAPLVELSEHDEEEDEDEESEEEAQKTEKALPPKTKRRLIKETPVVKLKRTRSRTRSKDAPIFASLEEAADSKGLKRKKVQHQEKSGETEDKTTSSPGSKVPKIVTELKSTEAASSEIGVSSKENVPIFIPVEGMTVVDPTRNLSQSSAIPDISKSSSMASPTRSTAVTSKVKLEPLELLTRLKEKLKKDTSSSHVSSSATSSGSIQRSPSTKEVSKARDALKVALSFNFEMMIQPEMLAKLKGALEVLTSSESIPDVPQDKLRQFKVVLPTLIQDYNKNMAEIQEMKNKQARFADLGQDLTIAMNKMEKFQHQKEQLSIQKKNGLKKIKEIQDNIALLQQQVVQLQTDDASHDERMQKIIQEEEEVTDATQPLVEEHDVLNAEIPLVEAHLETLVTNLSASTAPWDKFKAEVLEKM